MAKQEIEMHGLEVDELSKDTLKAYARKAVPDMQQSEQKAKDHINKSMDADDAGDTKSAEQHYKSAQSANSRKEKRMAGIMGAIKRIKNESEEIDEASIVTKRGPMDIRPGSTHKHEIIKDHGTHMHETGKEHRVFSVKQPNGFHGVLVTDKDKTQVIGQTHNNHTKEDALKIADHYKKHGQVGMSKHAAWYIGGDKIVNESELDEMDFGSIGKTLSKYGKGVPKDDPKKVSRSTVHTDYTMTGHKEKKSGTGRVYTKVLSDYDDDAPKAAKATQAPDQVEAPKRGRGRPAGALNKNGSGVTGKGWSDEAKASMKAKLAANKAAKLAAAAKNESELDEAAKKEVKDGDKPFKYAEWKASGKKPRALPGQGKNGVMSKFHKAFESVEITEEDWADITEGQSLDAIVEFMMDEEYQSLDELSKKTLKSYYAKASNEFRKAYNKAQDSRDKSYMQRLSGASTETKKYKALKDKESEARATILKINSGTIAAVHRLGKFANESVELEEAHKPGSVGISVNPGGSDLGKAGKKYTVFFHPEANSPRGRTKAVDISHHEDVDSAKAAKAAYVEKHKAHGVVALRGMGEQVELDESTEDLNIQRYAALIGKNLIKE